MSKICIINVYLGNLPDTFPIWLKSVKCNESIDFMLVTDADVDDIPANLRVVHMSLQEIKQLAEQEMNMKLTLETPYKLCDYKPVYGTVFRKFLKGYDYWGYCDLDLMFGDLRKFFEEYHLDKYDKFLDQGHLCLMRNTDKINQTYKMPGSYYSYKQVFTDNGSFVFDEYNRINSVFHHNRLPIFEKTIYANINPDFTRFKCCRMKNYRKQLFYFDSGKIFRAYCKRKGKVQYQEFLYIHLLSRKLGVVPQEIIDADRFAITENGYFLLDKTPDAEIVNQFTKGHTLRKEFSEFVPNFKKNWLSISELKIKLIIAVWRIRPFRQILMKIKNK